MVALVGLGKLGVAPIRPIKTPTIHDHTANTGTVATDILGRRMDHNIGPMVDWLPEVGGDGRCINNDGYTSLVGDGSDLLEIEHIELRITDQFEEEGLGTPIDRLAETLEVAAINEAGGDPDFGQGMAEEVVGTTVEIG